MKVLNKILIVAAISSTLLAIAYPLHTSIREGYDPGFICLFSYTGTEWLAVWGMGVLASITGIILKKRLPFLSNALLIGGSLCLIVPTIGRSSSPTLASPKLTLSILNILYFAWIAIQISRIDKLSSAKKGV